MADPASNRGEVPADLVRLATVRATIVFPGAPGGVGDAEGYPAQSKVLKEYLEGPFAEEAEAFLGFPVRIGAIAFQPGSLIVAFVLLAKVVPDVAKALVEAPGLMNQLDAAVATLLQGTLTRNAFPPQSMQVNSKAVYNLLERTAPAPAPPAAPAASAQVWASTVLAIGVVVLIGALVVLFGALRESEEAAAKANKRLEAIEKDMVRLNTLVEVMRSPGQGREPPSPPT